MAIIHIITFNMRSIGDREREIEEGNILIIMFVHTARSIHILRGIFVQLIQRRLSLHDDFFLSDTNRNENVAKATTTDNFTNSINALMMAPGNSIGRSCHKIKASTAAAINKIMVCFQFIAYLPVDAASDQKISYYSAFTECLTTLDLK